LPVVGKRYPVKPLIVDSSDPVKEWMRPTGDMGVVQVTCYPRCKDVLPLKHITPENKDKRVILSTTDVNGEIEITNVVKLKKSDIYKIDLKLNVRGIIRPDYFEGFEYPVEIKDGGIRLYQVENADLKPCFFPIDNVWPERFVSDNTGRTVKVKHTKKK
ncbi:MAG: hypothetical protein K2K92_07985, partial [Duncaniella sp.]|nr:hypothetical protein [Duncaniella sp.]